MMFNITRDRISGLEELVLQICVHVKVILNIGTVFVCQIFDDWQKLVVVYIQCTINMMMMVFVI